MKSLSIYLILFSLVSFLLVTPNVLASGEDKTDIVALSNSQVTDINGNQVLLGSIWQEKPIVLVFIRHFG
ncbi:MAG: hypothetical protein JNM06_13375 [Blastocatellia bacterium]|nr:hypothetical protein [Blastocatellia bacterium]MBN8723395.1 hypothetical protein [Acidobacteriota bacterium]